MQFLYVHKRAGPLKGKAPADEGPGGDRAHGDQPSRRRGSFPYSPLARPFRAGYPPNRENRQILPKFRKNVILELCKGVH